MSQRILHPVVTYPQFKLSMKFLQYLNVCLLALMMYSHNLSAQPKAQDPEGDFCWGLEQIMTASYTRFEEFNKDFNLEAVGVGKGEEATINYTQWTYLLKFSGLQPALDKYASIASLLSACKIDGSGFDYSEAGSERLKLVGYEKMGRWSLPNTHPYGDVYTEMFISKDQAGYALKFEVVNGDLRRKYEGSDKPAPRLKNRRVAEKVTSVADDICSGINKVLQANADFTDIKGKIIRTVGGIGVYESIIALPGSQESAVYASTLGTPSYNSRFISTENEAEAEEKYREIKSLLKACNFYPGRLVASEKVLEEDGRITTWLPFGLSDENAARYGALVIELVNEKNIQDKYDVELKISYNNQ